MIGRTILTVLALGLGGCGATAVVGAAASVVGAAASVVGAGVEVAGSAASATIDVVGSGVSGAIDLATSDDDDEKPSEENLDKADDAAKRVLADTEPVPETKPEGETDTASIDTLYDGE